SARPDNRRDHFRGFEPSTVREFRASSFRCALFFFSSSSSFSSFSSSSSSSSHHRLQLDQPKKKAASAAYTYFLAHSEDETSKKNVVYFRDGARVAEADFLDLEMLPYKV
ncbi:hypothetical protein RRG08_053926, partial [Elysia crispata]